MFKRIKIISASVVLAMIALLPGVATASNYGSGNYGACSYQDGCAVSRESNSETEVVELEPDQTELVLNTYDGFFVDAGITITNLKVGDVLNFCLSSSSCAEAKDDLHTITIKGIDLSNPERPVITLTFASTPFDVTFVKGDVKKIDVNQDGANDIEVTFVDVVDGHAILTTKNLSRTSDTSSASDKEVEKASSKAWIWVAVAVAVVLLVFIITRLV